MKKNILVGDIPNIEKTQILLGSIEIYIFENKNKNNNNNLIIIIPVLTENISQYK